MDANRPTLTGPRRESTPPAGPPAAGRVRARSLAAGERRFFRGLLYLMLVLCVWTIAGGQESAHVPSLFLTVAVCAAGLACSARG
jgi:hypothetical protein